MFSSLLITFIFYGICFYGMVCDDGKKKIISLSQDFTSKQKWIMSGIVLFFLILVLFWPQQNKYIYFWDFSGYWLASVRRADYIFNNSFIDNIKSLYNSINTQDYNIFLPTILALPMSIVGNSFVKYVFICCVIFLLPTYFVQAMIGTKIIKDESISKSSVFVISFVLAVLFVGNYFAVFRGYADVAYLLPMSVAMYLFIDYDFSKVNTKRNIAIALNLVLIWICRRYTVYFLIGYVVALGIKALSYLVRNRNLRTIIFNFIQIGTVSLGILLVFFSQFILRALLTDYAKIYSAYNASIKTKILFLESSFGIITIILILIAGISCFIAKKEKLNYFALLIMLITEIVIFWKTQAMSAQHSMILNLPIYTIVLMIFNIWSVKISKKKYYTNFIVILSTLALMANFSKSFMNDVVFDKENKLFSRRHIPLVRNDIDALNLLAEKLNKLTQGTDDKIYVVASTLTLNESLLRNLYVPEKFDAIPNMLHTHDIDLRDGFPTHFLQARYIVTTYPIQKGQLNEEYLSGNIQNPESHIGKHYRYLDEVELQNMVIAKIYEKISEYTEDDLQVIRDYYTNIYPDDKKIFADRIFIK